MKYLSTVTDNSYKLILDYSNDNKPNPLTKLTCARNSSVSFQVILQADSRYCVNVGTATWFSQKGVLLQLRQEINSPFPVRQQIEGLMLDDDDIKKADILMSQSVVEEAANIPTAVWVEIDVPKEAIVGEYKIEIMLYQSSICNDELLLKSSTIELDVKEYCMQDTKDFTFYLDLWQHNSNIARKHEVALWSDRHFEIMERYVASLANLSQKSITIVASQIPWRGQACFLNHRNPSNLFEYSIIGIVKQINGEFSYDFSAMQRYIDLCNRYGINGDIEVFGLVNVWVEDSFDKNPICVEYPENILLRYLDMQSGCYKYMKNATEIKEYIVAIEQYFIKTGQIKKVRVAADEPVDIEKYRKSVDLVHQIAPNFVFKTAINHAEFIKEFHDIIGDFAPSVYCASTEFNLLKDYKNKFPDKKFLWYVCCGPEYPNTFLKSNLLESRFIGILTALTGFDGFLRWNYTVWTENPREDIRYTSFPAGDTNFVYPSFGGDVLLSVRYKQLRYGIEDFELIAELNRRGKQEIVKKALAYVVRTADFASYYCPTTLDLESICSLSYADYVAAHELMLNELSN